MNIKAHSDILLSWKKHLKFLFLEVFASGDESMPAVINLTRISEHAIALICVFHHFNLNMIRRI